MSDETASAVEALAPAHEEIYAANSYHLVRTAQQQTMQLSQMADQKASILMGATFVVFTVAIGQASRTQLSWSLAVLASFAFVSAVLAVTAVSPRVSPRTAPINPNLLFFGNFARMSEAEFIAAVKHQLLTDDDIFTTMLRDMHQNGSLLATRKYHYLALAYRCFVMGLTLTFIIFVIEHARSLLALVGVGAGVH